MFYIRARQTSSFGTPQMAVSIYTASIASIALSDVRVIQTQNILVSVIYNFSRNVSLLLCVLHDLANGDVYHIAVFSGGFVVLLTFCYTLIPGAAIVRSRACARILFVLYMCLAVLTSLQILTVTKIWLSRSTEWLVTKVWLWRSTMSRSRVTRPFIHAHLT